MYKKINIYLKSFNGYYKYEASTNMSKTCKEAKAKFLLRVDYLDSNQVKASYK